MPIYTYECSLCKTRFEEQRSMTDPDRDVAAHDHPEKGMNIPARRVFSPGDMRPVFKGRGWARKDHKDASKP